MSSGIYADALVAIADDLYKKGSGDALLMDLRISLDKYSDEDGFEPVVAGYLNLVCYAPRNYMRVYACVTPKTMPMQEMQWRLLCSHDSAWRDDGIRSGVRGFYQAAMRLARSKLSGEPGREHIAIAKLAIAPVNYMLPEGIGEDTSGPRMNWDEAVAALARS